MTVPARLEALEQGQVTILLKLGDVEKEVGEVKADVSGLSGTVGEWKASTDRLAAVNSELCRTKHEQIEAMLDEHSQSLEEHHARLKKLELQSQARIANWSLTKKVLAATGSFAGFVLIVLGIAEAVKHFW